ncbi:MAG TPA: winged helix-turn-helix domain-containing protein [Micromonosporaceae bacterium]
MPTATYIRIADKIIEDIRSGRIQPGDQLPSIAALSAQFGVSTSTIQLVNVRLEALRVILKQQGKGIFVNDPKRWMREPEEE